MRQFCMRVAYLQGISRASFHLCLPAGIALRKTLTWPNPPKCTRPGQGRPQGGRRQPHPNPNSDSRIGAFRHQPATSPPPSSAGRGGGAAGRAKSDPSPRPGARRVGHPGRIGHCGSSSDSARREKRQAKRSHRSPLQKVAPVTDGRFVVDSVHGARRPCACSNGSTGARPKPPSECPISQSHDSGRGGGRVDLSKGTGATAIDTTTALPHFWVCVILSIDKCRPFVEEAPLARRAHSV